MIDRKIAAPILDDLIEIASGMPEASDDATKEYVMVLIDRIKKLAICGDDERRDLWLWTERGTIDDFGDFNEYLEWGGVENHEEFCDLWRGYYPSELKWYKMTFASYNS